MPELPNLSVKQWTVKNEECLSLIKKEIFAWNSFGNN